jgi:hypothetical protein
MSVLQLRLDLSAQISLYSALCKRFLARVIQVAATSPYVSLDINLVKRFDKLAETFLLGESLLLK